MSTAAAATTSTTSTTSPTSRHTARTKIVCTIGPASSSPAVLRALITAGMNVARINFSHGTHDQHTEVIRGVRAIAKEIGRPVAILGDLQGPRIRIGDLPAPIMLLEGSDIMLAPEAVARIVARFEAAGAHAKVSSIHVNGWFGDCDKLATSLWLLRERFGCDAEQARESAVFVGDSPNDAPMFGYFRHGVGVANVREFAGRLAAEPAWIATARGGAGFAELARALLAARP